MCLRLYAMRMHVSVFTHYTGLVLLGWWHILSTKRQQNFVMFQCIIRSCTFHIPHSTYHKHNCSLSFTFDRGLVIRCVRGRASAVNRAHISRLSPTNQHVHRHFIAARLLLFSHNLISKMYYVVHLPQEIFIGCKFIGRPNDTLSI